MHQGNAMEKDTRTPVERAADARKKEDEKRLTSAEPDASPQSAPKPEHSAPGTRSWQKVPPPPDRVIRGSAPLQPRQKVGPIRWPVWLALPHVELWEAVALSLGANPVPQLREEASMQPTRLSRLTHDFHERLRFCQRAVLASGPIKLQGRYYTGASHGPYCKVSLCDVSAFLLQGGFEVAPEMLSGCSTELHPSSNDGDGAVPMQRWPAQEAAILTKLREMGFDPCNLPMPKPGTPGPKAAVKRALGTSGMWTGETVFDKAWERLRASGQVS
jgi:hypothetical protein